MATRAERRAINSGFSQPKPSKVLWVSALARRRKSGRSDVSVSTPSAPRVLSDSDYRREFAVWTEAVDTAAHRRASLEKLILARGVVRPVALTRRFVRKSAEVGFVGALSIVNQRARAKLRGRAS